MRKSAARDRAIVVDGRGVNPNLGFRRRGLGVDHRGGAASRRCFRRVYTMYECIRTVQDHPHAGCRRTTTRVVARAVILDVDGRPSVRR